MVDGLNACSPGTVWLNTQRPIFAIIQVGVIQRTVGALGNMNDDVGAGSKGLYIGGVAAGIQANISDNALAQIVEE